jgi:hypothetical protein
MKSLHFIRGPRTDDLYEVLGVPRNANSEMLALAYFREIAYWDPEFNVRPDAASRYRAVKRAYQVLDDPQARARHDRELSGSGTSGRRQLIRLWPIALAAAAIIVTPLAAYALPRVGGLGHPTIQLPSLPQTGASGTPQQPATPTGKPTAATPSSPGDPAPLSLDPKQSTLQPADLPSGYHPVSAGPAAFKAGSGTTVPSWDTVFQRAAAGSSLFRVAESMTLVFPSASEGKAASDNTGADEVASGASLVRSSSTAEGEQLTWSEPVRDHTELRLFRVTWRWRNVVGELGLLGPAVAGLDSESAALAQAQQQRMAAAVR